MSLRSKIISWGSIAFLVFALTLFAISTLLTSRVNTFVINIAERMTKEIGHPVTIDSVVTRWDWLLLKVSIKNIKIFEKNGTTPLFIASEIVSTVDTLDSIRSLSLRFKQLLLRSPRLVMQWNGTEPPSILGLEKSDVTDSFNPAAIAKILAMQRRIIVENGDLHLQGKNGADLPFMDIRIDYKQQGAQEYTIVARGNIAAAVQPEFVIAIKYFGELDHYDKAMLEFEIKTSNMQFAEIFNFVPKYRQDMVRGDFADFDVRGVVQNGTVRSVNSDFSITNISIANDMQIKGGVGHIEYRPGDNKVGIQLEHVHLHNNKLYSQPISIDSINTDLVYNELLDGQVQISTKNARVKLMEMDFRPEFSANIIGNTVSEVTFATDLEDASVRRSLVLVPDQKLSLALIEWLKKAIIDGEISRVKIDFADHKLKWCLAFKNAEIKFSPEWPSIYGIDAMLTMNDGKLGIDATRAMILGNELRTLNTSYNEVNGKPYALITIDGSMDTTLETAMNYIQQTPLQEKFGRKLETFNPSGPIGLALQLNINLALPEVAIAVKGAIDLKNAKLQANEIDLDMSDINGVLAFSNNSFTAKNLRLTMLGQPAIANVAMHALKNNVLNIAVAVPVKIQTIKPLVPSMNLDHLSGMTNVTANLELPWGGNNQDKTLIIRSDLVGVGINYPAPFNKLPQTKLPLTVQYHMQSKREDNVKFKIGVLDGILFLKDRKLHGGRVAVGTKLENFTETENLQISGNLKTLNWADWSPLMKTSIQGEILPVEIDMVIDSLALFGEEFKPIHVKYNTIKNEIFVDSHIVTGTMAFNPEAEIVNIKLDKLNVPETRGKSTALVDYMREKRKISQLPLIQFYCEQLQINKRHFKKISLDLLPRTYGYEIMNFTINNDHLLLQAQGAWQMEGTPLTTLSGSIYTQNFGKVLGEWGYNNAISRGKGELNFNVQWEGGPIDFDVSKVSGKSHFDLRSGSLPNVNPGIGRILSLLSLETIQRRLQLDFSDLISKGFAFDKFVADVKMEHGDVMSDNILITSPAAKIELFGKTGIKSQNLEFTMLVTPKVGAGLPIAAAIAAGNPAVGAAIWLFDKASGSKISEITKYRYKVSGSWDAPKIDEITARNDNVKLPS